MVLNVAIGEPTFFKKHEDHQPKGVWEKKLVWKEDWVKEWKTEKKEVWKTELKKVQVPVWKEIQVPIWREVKTPDWKIIKKPVWVSTMLSVLII